MIVDSNFLITMATIGFELRRCVLKVAIVETDKSYETEHAGKTWATCYEMHGYPYPFT